MKDDKVVVFDAALHHSGQRVLDQAVQDARDRAYYEMVARAQDAWRTPERREQDAEIACVIGRDQAMITDAQARRDATYWRYVEESVNAWKTPS
ncbi:MAG TPA: hypothetical protein VKE42_03200 [Candidatus Cybelea sp.]|nr:hypothetical protein [Candidatus Cybelea sp.]